MSALKAIRDDLVEKRLWPVAVVLVLALIAVPVVLGRSGGSVSPPPLPTQIPVVAAGDATSAQQAAVLDKTTPRQVVRGSFHDPFRSGHSATAQPAAGGSGASTGVAKTVAPATTTPSRSSSTGGGGGAAP
ncbi:MAG: hypothetical protein JWM71_164, partial [Solirubrobacteraceae bacterium]|nr:hypothetical protein [Solirubrobacteraceae bacterium]